MKKLDFSMYTEKWRDDFYGDSLDADNWGYELGYVRNQELQEYTNSGENVKVENGELVLSALREVREGNKVYYSSGSVETAGKQEFLYGKIEMKAKLPGGKGIWPAFWTLGSSFRDIGWPDCGEIDIMELVGGDHDPVADADKEPFFSDSRAYGNIHYRGKTGNVASKTFYHLPEGRYCEGYHLFGLIWTKEKMEWYIDDSIYLSADITRIPEFHKPHFLKLNIAVGGCWAAEVGEKTVFPQEYRIDYISYSQTQEDEKDRES
jgi:beta-glucanase (GH16 family)